MNTTSRSIRVKALVPAVLLAATSMLAACGGDDAAFDASDPLGKGATIDAPSDPGSGYDQTARGLEQALTDEDLAGRVQVTNSPGAGGTVALASFVKQKDPTDLMIGGLSLVGAIITNKSEEHLTDLTPIARLIGEYEVIVVPADSEYDSLEGYLAGLKADPGAHPIAIGNQGGVDHMWGGILVKGVGVEPTDVNFVTYDGGAEVTTALLGGEVTAGISGYAEFAAQIDEGELKVLAVSSDEPLEIAPDAATVVDAGYPDAVLVNWRGIFAPPGITDEERDALSDTFEKLNDSDAWTALREKNGWSDQFLDAEEFAGQLETEETDADALLKELGLA